MDEVLKRMQNQQELTEEIVKYGSESGLKISVLISTYRRSAYLIRMLDSIKMQRYKNCEIIIVDDASGDDTGETVKQYRAVNPELEIKYSVNKKNLGISESKKRGYEKATGDIIIFADDDDYYIEPEYFNILNQIYNKHPDCTMTIAATIKHNKRERKDEFLGLNTPETLSTREYLNGFMGRYNKPTVFAMSLRRTGFHYEELLCYNDTSLFLTGLLGKGNVYTIDRTVGVYYFHEGNMTGNTTAEFIVDNLESKEDIYKRAMAEGLLDNPKEWHYRSIAVTAGYHLAGSRNKEDKIVWKWLKEHLNRKDYYRFAGRMMKAKVRRCLHIASRYASKNIQNNGS